MNRPTTVLVAIVVTVALIAIPLGAGVALADDGAETDANEHANDSVAPGQQLAGVVGVQHAEVDGELADRTFGVQLANAQTDNETADVVEARLGEITERLADHEAVLADLTEARENGDLSEGEYRAKVAIVAAENANTERAANHSGAAAGELPEHVLADRGINVSAIEELRTNASNLTGPEVAEIAQSIAGENVGAGLGPDREPGPPEGVGPATDSDDDREPGPPEGVGPGADDDADDVEAVPEDDAAGDDDVEGEDEDAPDDDDADAGDDVAEDDAEPAADDEPVENDEPAEDDAAE